MVSEAFGGSKGCLKKKMGTCGDLAEMLRVITKKLNNLGKRCFICKDKSHLTCKCPFKSILPSKCSIMEEEEKMYKSVVLEKEDHVDEEILREELVIKLGEKSHENVFYQTKVEESIELNISGFKVSNDKNEEPIDEKQVKPIENIGIKQPNTNFNNHFDLRSFYLVQEKLKNLIDEKCVKFGYIFEEKELIRGNIHIEACQIELVFLGITEFEVEFFSKKRRMMQDDAIAIGLFKIKSHVNLFNIWIWFILSFKYGFGQYCLLIQDQIRYLMSRLL